MKSLYGSILNILFLMFSRTLLLLILLIVAAIGIYLIGEIDSARGIAQLLVLVIFPLLTVWTARSSYSSKWNIFEQSWSTSPVIMVISRYILFALINLIVSFFWYMSLLFDGNYRNLVHTMSSAYLAMAIYYPIMYLLRGERGDLDQIIFIASVLGAIFGLGYFINLFGESIGLVLVGVTFIISMMRFDIARPSPVPPYCLVVPASACVKALKTLSSCSGVIPIPLSRTSKYNVALSSSDLLIKAVSLINPSLVNFTALESRFKRT